MLWLESQVGNCAVWSPHRGTSPETACRLPDWATRPARAPVAQRPDQARSCALAQHPSSAPSHVLRLEKVCPRKRPLDGPGRLRLAATLMPVPGMGYTLSVYG